MAGQRSGVAIGRAHAGSLNREQTLELQTLLNGLGYDAGEPDGLFGSGTRGAVRAFQAAQSLPADGFPDRRVAHAHARPAPASRSPNRRACRTA